MKFYSRVANRQDLYDVFSDLSDISKEEQCVGKTTWWNALKAADELHKYHPAVAIIREGETIAIFGHNKHPENKKTRVTWFVARPVFFRGVASTIFARKYLNTLGARWPGVIFQSYTTSKHPQVRRWFELLGFKHHGKNLSASARYDFLPPAKAQSLGAA